MPAPGDVNNPAGSNGTQVFDGFAQESTYGAIKRAEQSTRAAPINTPGANAARQAQRRAVSGARANTQPVETPPTPPQPADISPHARLATQLAVLAAVPGISPLVQEDAAVAQRTPGG